MTPDDPIDLSALSPEGDAWLRRTEATAARVAARYRTRSALAGQIRWLGAPAFAFAAAAALLLWVVPPRPSARPSRSAHEAMLEWAATNRVPRASEVLAIMEVSP